MKSKYRVAELIVRLMNGETLLQMDVLKQYDISKRTSQRDLADIRSAMSEYDAGEVVETDGTYCLSRQSEQLDFEMVLTVSNILLGSRSLEQDELTRTLDFLISQLSPAMQDLIHKQLKISRGGYVPLSKPTPLLNRLREVALCIAQNRKMVFVYRGSAKKYNKPQKHHAQPVAFFFEVHYFYVAMMSEEHGGYWLYRLDRIVDILETKKGEKLDYIKRFSLQDHRSQTYLLDSGDLTRIQFSYRYYEQTALDFFPRSRVVKYNEDGSVVIEAFAKVDGAVLWLLSQGEAVKVLAPQSLVERMKETLTNTRNQYLD